MRTNRSASIPIYDGDDFERLAELRRTADQAEAAVQELQERRGKITARLGDDDAQLLSDAKKAADDAKRAYNEFVDEAAERAMNVKLQRIPGRKFRDLMADHKPREDNRHDAAWDVNMDTFPDALLAYRDENAPEDRTIVEPEFASSGDLKRFLDDLALGDLELFFEVAYGLNRNPSSDPKADRYFDVLPTSAAT